MSTYDIFISYARKDTEWVRILAKLLDRTGYDVWWDRDSIPPGSAFEDEIRRGIDRSDIVIVIWSKEAAVSSWVQLEADLAFQQNKIVLVCIDDTPVPEQYSHLHYIEMAGWAGDANAQSFLDLLAGIRRAQHQGARRSLAEMPIAGDILKRVDSEDGPGLFELFRSTRVLGIRLERFVLAPVVAGSMMSILQVAPALLQGRGLLAWLPLMVTYAVLLMILKVISFYSVPKRKRNTQIFFDAHFATQLFLAICVTGLATLIVIQTGDPLPLGALPQVCMTFLAGIIGIQGLWALCRFLISKV